MGMCIHGLANSQEKENKNTLIIKTGTAIPVGPTPDISQTLAPTEAALPKAAGPQTLAHSKAARPQTSTSPPSPSPSPPPSVAAQT